MWRPPTRVLVKPNGSILDWAVREYSLFYFLFTLPSLTTLYMIDSELINCETKWLEAGVLSDIYIIIVSISFKHFFRHEKKTFDILNTPLLLVGQNRISSNPVIHLILCPIFCWCCSYLSCFFYAEKSLLMIAELPLPDTMFGQIFQMTNYLFGALFMSIFLGQVVNFGLLSINISFIAIVFLFADFTSSAAKTSRESKSEIAAVSSHEENR